MERFGEKLRTLREREGMTQRQLARELGFAAHAFINFLETGKRKPSAELVKKIASLFHVTTDQLLWVELDVE